MSFLSRAIKTFLGLTDTPAAYTDQALKNIRVNAGEDALEFAAAAAGLWEHIATLVLSAQGTFTFDSISSDYEILRLFGTLRTGGAGGDRIGMIRFNDDDDTHYNRQILRVTGSDTFPAAQVNQTECYAGLISGSYQSMIEIYIQNLQGTADKIAHCMCAGHQAYLTHTSNRWTGGAQITKILIFADAVTDFAVASFMTLEGLKKVAYP